MNIKSIRQLKIKDLKGKRVLVRCDFDVPIKEIRNKKLEIRDKIADDTRLRALIPTISYLRRKKAKVILMGHLGRPKGKFDKNLSLEVVAKRLEKLLNTAYRIPSTRDTEKISNIKYSISNIQYQNINNKDSRITNYELRITFINDCIGPKTERAVENMKEGEVLVLENLRFYMGERKNDDKFAKELAKLADIYVNESIAVSHRKHASLDAIRDYLPGYTGLHLEKEIKALYGVFKKPSRPLVLIIGGVKVATKLPVIDNFLFRADYVLIGGVVANNFLHAAGFEIGRSKYDKKYLKEAKRILNKGLQGILGSKETSKKLGIARLATRQGSWKLGINDFNNLTLKNIERLKKRVVLPVDLRVETRNLPVGKAGKKLEIKELNNVGKMDSIYDIGPKTVKLYERIIRGARIVVWNGPLGYFEDRRFADGTKSIARAVISSRARAIIGGGETIGSITRLLDYSIDDLPKRIFVSMAGGAMLEILAGEKLPGLRGLICE